MMKYGKGGEKDNSGARNFFQKACKGGEARGCSDLGAMHVKGQGGRKNYLLARRYLGRGCEGRHFEGCNNLAVMFNNGWGGGKNRIIAAALYKYACKMKYKSACKHYSDGITWLQKYNVRRNRRLSYQQHLIRTERKINRVEIDVVLKKNEIETSRRLGYRR